MRPIPPKIGQNPINARKGITTLPLRGAGAPQSPGQNPINARKGITTDQAQRPQVPAIQSESY